MKKCPFCQEEIQNSAVKCRYCGEWIEKKEEPVGLSSQQSTAPAVPTEKNKQKSKIIFSSWKTSILALVIAAFGLAFIGNVSKTKVSPMEVFWTWMWLQLTFDGWKYLKWRTLLPFPIVIFTLSFILIITGGQSQSPNFWYIGSAAILNISGLIIFYLYLKKSQKEIIGEKTTSNIIKQEKEDSSEKKFYHTEHESERSAEKVRNGNTKWTIPIIFIGIVFIVIAIVATYFSYKEKVGLSEVALTEAPEPPKVLTAEDWYYKATALWDGKQYSDPQKAIEYLNNAINLKPDDAIAYCVRGFTYAELGKYQLAIEDYNEAIRLKPDYAYAYYSRGKTYNNLNQYQGAIDDLNQACRLQKDYADAYISRGIAYNGLGKHQRAIEDYNEAILLQPNDAKAYNLRGACYLIKGNNKLGCLDAQKACELGVCKTLEYGKSKGFCR